MRLVFEVRDFSSFGHPGAIFAGSVSGSKDLAGEYRGE
jgi:hypothetical protein